MNNHSVLLLLERFLDLIGEGLTLGEHLGTRVDAPGSDSQQMHQYQQVHKGLDGRVDSRQEVVALQYLHRTYIYIKII